MKTSRFLALLIRTCPVRRLVGLACGALGVLSQSEVWAQKPQGVTTLDPLVTTATRTPAAPQTIGATVDVITAADLARRQVSSLSSALGIGAGTPHFSSGASGAINSLFLRGANSNQTLFLVDGIRFNDSNTD